MGQHCWPNSVSPSLSDGVPLVTRASFLQRGGPSPSRPMRSPLSPTRRPLSPPPLWLIDRPPSGLSAEPPSALIEHPRGSTAPPSRSRPLSQGPQRPTEMFRPRAREPNTRAEHALGKKRRKGRSPPGRGAPRADFAPCAGIAFMKSDQPSPHVGLRWPPPRISSGLGYGDWGHEASPGPRLRGGGTGRVPAACCGPPGRGP